MIGFSEESTIVVHIVGGVRIKFRPMSWRVVETPDSWGVAGSSEIGEVFIPGNSIAYVQELVS